MVKPRLKRLKEPALNLADWLLNSEPPPEGLVPIGDTGLYITPTEPADPRDCDRYPDSPFCGGNPLSPELADIGIVFTIDECNIGITLYPTFLFYKLPPLTIVYRRPECRIEPPPEPELEDPELPFECGVYATVTIGGSIVFTEPIPIRRILSARKIPGIYVGSFGYLYEDWIIYYQDAERNTQQLWNTYTYQNDPKDSNQYSHYSGKYLDEELLKENRAIPIEDSQRDYSPETEGKVLTVYRGKQPYHLIINRCPFPDAATKPPPPPKDKCCMGCCPPQDDQLTRLLLRKVLELTQKTDKLAQIVGVDEYPASLPSSLITKADGSSKPSPKSINNLTQLFGWYIERFDELMGQWEIPIDVEDIDETQAGNQEKHIRLPNLAEAVAEMMGLLLQTTINSESLVNITTRTLAEAGMNKQQGFKNYYMLDTLIDYLGFQTKDTAKKLSLTFKPGEEDLEKVLKETEIDVRVTELDDRNTFKSNMQDLLHAAAIIRAVHWRKFKNDDTLKEQFIDLIKGYAGINQKLSGDEKDSNGKDDLDRFLDDAERGFIDSAGITDSTHPYGRNYAERPHIRRIGNQTPTEDT